MKYLFGLFFFGVLLMGCGTSQSGRQYEFRKPDITIASNVGYLVVETDKMKAKDFSDDVEYEIFKGYSIYTPQGIHVMDVPKSNFSPVCVKLKADDYIIVAEMHNNIIQSFAIKIEKGKILKVNKSMVENSISELSEKSTAY